MTSIFRLWPYNMMGDHKLARSCAAPHPTALSNEMTMKQKWKVHNYCIALTGQCESDILRMVYTEIFLFFLAPS